MASGIYLLTFDSGRYYIGKSNDIERRWKEHGEKFERGTAAKLMQAEFNRYGHPVTEVLVYAHPDHIDILENYYINSMWGPNILNTTRPDPYLPKGIELIEASLNYRNGAIFTLGTLDHIQQWNDVDAKYKELQEKVKRIKNGKIVEELEAEVYSKTLEIQKLKEENRRLKNRGFWDRLFNIY